MLVNRQDEAEDSAGNGQLQRQVLELGSPEVIDLQPQRDKLGKRTLVPLASRHTPTPRNPFKRMHIRVAVEDSHRRAMIQIR